LALTLARLADEAGLDLIGVQDHPYNTPFLDTWTLLATIGAMTRRVRLLPNVLNLPLRPPAMLAKAAASLDLITDGRVELGLGAGAFWDGVAAYGGPRHAPGEAVEALEEAIQVLRRLWSSPDGGGTVSFAGAHYRLVGAQPGPAPAHPIGLWLGALRPRLLRATGRLADGWLVSNSYVPPEEVSALQAHIDEGARAAGRDPSAIRRGYNVAGVITRPGQRAVSPQRRGVLVGPVDAWVDAMVRYYDELRLDSFVVWPLMGDEEIQARLVAEEIAPAVRRALGSGG
jgi:alkanesulfonate monooxygenase SsuD/methylene tetrahydromethanopterin reductase-like flavin-dependent oxidoreductase (luciferase family)